MDGGTLSPSLGGRTAGKLTSFITASPQVLLHSLGSGFRHMVWGREDKGGTKMCRCGGLVGAVSCQPWSRPHHRPHALEKPNTGELLPGFGVSGLGRGHREHPGVGLGTQLRSSGTEYISPKSLCSVEGFPWQTK